MKHEAVISEVSFKGGHELFHSRLQFPLKLTLNQTCFGQLSVCLSVSLSFCSYIVILKDSLLLLEYLLKDTEGEMGNKKKFSMLI